MSAPACRRGPPGLRPAPGYAGHPLALARRSDRARGTDYRDNRALTGTAYRTACADDRAQDVTLWCRSSCACKSALESRAPLIGPTRLYYLCCMRVPLGPLFSPDKEDWPYALWHRTTAMFRR